MLDIEYVFDFSYYKHIKPEIKITTYRLGGEL